MYPEPQGQNSANLKVVVAVAMLLLVVIVLMSVMYVWSASFLQDDEGAPLATFSATKQTDGTYLVKVIKVSGGKSLSMYSFHYFIKDGNRSTIETGEVAGIMGFAAGSGRAVCYNDNDQDSRLSSGDTFLIIPGEPGSTLENRLDLEGYIFELHYSPTNDIIGSTTLP